MSNKANPFLKRKSVRITLKAINAFFKCILTIILIGTITASIVGCVLVVYVFTSFNGENIPQLKDVNLNESSIIYTKNSSGNFKEFQRVEGVNCIWTDYNDIPVNMQNAVIAIEDERFREHCGVDWKRTVSAFANMVLHFDSRGYGGSTITQQLIKNLSKDDDVKISRKIREIFRAIEMERNYYTKDEILEAYLNILPLSGNITGVGAAANYYFAKDIKDLTIAECAVIAGITQNPSKYNPYMHPDNVKQRQKIVLYKMFELGMITEDEYKQAYNQELVYNSSLRRTDKQDYYTDLLTEDVIHALMENFGYSKEYATSMYYFGGLRIYSAENPDLQKRVEDIFANEKNFPRHNKNDKEDPQSGIAIMDYTGRMVATVGGRGEKTANRVFNRSTDSTRQPGSAMKPIAVYAPAIEYNLVTYSTIMEDKPITLANGDKWPNNYGNYKYGSLPLEDALRFSLNTVPAQLIEQLTPQKSFDFLTNSLHLTTLVKARQSKTDIVPALALGGLTDGVRCIEMAAAYQVFGNGGFYNKPYTFYRVERDGNTLVENSPTNAKVISEDTAYVMNRLLQRVIVGPHGTGRGNKIGSFETFGKTGTTNDDKDVYFVGGTPYYVGACWFGYDNNQTLRVTTYAKRLWKASMNALHSGLNAKTFDKKGTTVELPYCRATGEIADSGCTDTAIGVYKAENVPGKCHIHGSEPVPSTKNPMETSPTSSTNHNKTTTTSSTKNTTTSTTSSKTTSTKSSSLESQVIQPAA